MSESQDRWLLERLAAGDREAFRAIYDEHVRSIYAVALRLTGSYEDAEEAAHDAFMDLVRLGPKAREIGSVRAWLLRVAMRRAADAMRLRGRQPRLAGSLSEPDSGVLQELDALGLRWPDPKAAHEARDMAERVRHLSRQLPERQAMAFALRHYQGLSIAEVAAAMSCTDGAVKAHLHLALKRLRELLRDEGSSAPERNNPREEKA